MSLDTNVIEAFLDSMNIVSKKVVDEISYDSTIECEICDNSNAKNGIYIVSNGSSKFEAYSEKTSYAKNAKVRVSIPNGDMTQKKYIIGLAATSDDCQPITYLSAMNTILDIVDLTKNQKFGAKLIANGNKEIVQIGSFPVNKELWQGDLYSTLFIEADFKTNLNKSNIVSGAYGLKIIVHVDFEDGTEQLKDFYFDSSEFFGNPYKFIINSNQAKKFNIKNFKRISKIDIEFYQDNQFTEWANGQAQFLSANNQIYNLFVDNIKLGFGSDLSEISDNTIKLITVDNTVFDYKIPPSEKKLEFLWYNKSEENKYIGFSDGIAKRKKDTDLTDGQLKNVLGDEGIDKDGYLLMDNYDENAYLALQNEDIELKAQKSNSVPTDRDSLLFMKDIQAIDTSLQAIQNKRKELFSLIKNINNSLLGLEDFQGILEDQEKKLNDLSSSIETLINGDNENKSIKSYYKNLLAYAAYIYKSYADYPENKGEDQQLIKETVRELPIDDLFLPGQDYTGSYLDKIKDIKNIFFTAEEESSKGIFEEIENLIFTLKEEKSNYYRYLIKYEKDFYSIKNFLEETFESISEKIPGSVEFSDSILVFQRIIDTSNDVIEYKPETIKNITIKNIAGEEIIKYKNYNDKPRDVWVEKDLSIFDNLYCIYWYRYDKEQVEASDAFGGQYWKRIDSQYKEYTQSEIEDVNTGLKQTIFEPIESSIETLSKNIGLPDIDNEEKNNEWYWQLKAENKDLKVFLNPQKEQEKFKVIIIYNHIPYESNELIFKNETHPNNLDRQDINVLEIEHIKNSQNNYVIYDGSTKLLLDSTQANIKREIKAVYKGDKTLEEAWKDGYIFWYCPINSTLLDFDLSLLEEKGFQSDSQLYIKPIGTNIYDEEFSIKKDGDGKERIFKSNQGYRYQRVYQTLEDDTTKLFYKIINIEEDPETGISKEEILLIPETGILKKEILQIENKNDKYNNMIYFYKKISDENDLSFFYKIKNVYELTEKNVIYCIIVKDEQEYNNNISFTFNTFGSNGTDYTIVVTPKDWSQVAFIDENDFFDLEVKVLDKDGREIEFEDIQTNWVGPSVYQVKNINGKKISIEKREENYTIDLSKDTVLSIGETYSYINNENKTISGTINLEEVKKSINLDKEELTVGSFSEKVLKIMGIIFKSIAVLAAQSEIRNYGILNIKIPGIAEGITLETVYAIPWASSINYRFNGASSVIYNSQGTNPIYIRNPYKLFDKNNELDGLKWEIIYYDSQLEKIDTENFIQYRATIENDILKPNSLFIDNIPIYPVVQCSQNGYILWQYPLIIMQNQYESTLLNKWDGNQIVDANDNYILTAMVGAGIKNSDNTFSGVLMGDVQGTSEYLKTGIGLYGFHRGGQSFGFNVDGTAFLGKSGKGRIQFDGNKGIIYSSTWYQSFYDENNALINPLNPPINANGEIGIGNDGLCIDLDNGHIDAYNFKLTSGNTLLLQSNPEENENYLFLGDSKNSYLQFTESGKLTIKVDTFELTSSENSSSDDPPPLGTNFSDAIFKKIDSSSPGIYLEDGKLLINASGIRTGVLTSQQKTSDGIPNMTINMNTGHIDAYNFKLTGGGDSLYLNSNPSEDSIDYYFKIEKGQSYLHFTQDGALQLNLNGPNSSLFAKDFELDALTTIIDNTNINLDYWEKSAKFNGGAYQSLQFKVEAQVCLEISTGSLEDNYSEAYTSGGWKFIGENWRSYLTNVKKNENGNYNYSINLYYKLENKDSLPILMNDNDDITPEGWKFLKLTVYNIKNIKKKSVGQEDSRMILRLGSNLETDSFNQFGLKFNPNGFEIYRQQKDFSVNWDQNYEKYMETIFSANAYGASGIFNSLIFRGDSLVGPSLPEGTITITDSETGVEKTINLQDGLVFFLLEETEQ